MSEWECSCRKISGSFMASEWAPQPGDSQATQHRILILYKTYNIPFGFKILGHCCSLTTQAPNCTPLHVMYVAHLCGRMVTHYFYGVMRWGTLLWSKGDSSLIFKTTHYAANTYQREQPAWTLWYAQRDLNMLRPCLSLELTHFNSE